MISNLQSSLLTLAGKQIELRISEPLLKQDHKLFKGKKRAGSWAVICHPHPQFGGTMDNKVATTLEKSFQTMGYGTISFNFRGVGQSEGEYDAGEGEAEDLVALVNWLRVAYSVDHLTLAGFSFGTFVILNAFEQCEVDQLCLVAPPVNMYDYSRFELSDVPTLVVQGGEDEVVPSEEVRDWITSLQKKSGLHLDLCWRGSASHYFHKQLVWLKKCLFLNFE